MARVPIKKEITNARLLKEYASWIYCAECNNTVAYLCYVTYADIDLAFTCTCGNQGRVKIGFDEKKRNENQSPLLFIKNRYCCPKDNSPLISFVDKNLQSYYCKISCVQCDNTFFIEK